jgi:DNA polymerase III delta subunit
MPFLAERRLVIVSGLPKATKEEIQILPPQIHPQVILLFVEPKIDKRLAGNKEILALADIKEFPLLKGALLSRWLAQESQQRGAVFAPAASTLLLEFVGDDQGMLMQEIEKLSLASKGVRIESALVEEMVVPTDEGIVWKLTDLLCSGYRTDAHRYARRILDRGGDAYGLWAILLAMLRNLVLIKAALESGDRNGAAIAQKTGIHPFAVRSLQQYAQNISLADLQSCLRWAAQADIDLKTGALKATEEAPQEILALVDLCIAKVPAPTRRAA